MTLRSSRESRRAHVHAICFAVTSPRLSRRYSPVGTAVASQPIKMVMLRAVLLNGREPVPTTLQPATRDSYTPDHASGVSSRVCHANRPLPPADQPPIGHGKARSLLSRCPWRRARYQHVLLVREPCSRYALLYFIDFDGEQTLMKRLDRGAFLLPAPAADGAPFVVLRPSMLPRLFRT